MLWGTPEWWFSALINPLPTPAGKNLAVPDASLFVFSSNPRGEKSKNMFGGGGGFIPRGSGLSHSIFSFLTSVIIYYILFFITLYHILSYIL